MGYVLLLIESLTLTLLLVATVLACVARFRSRWLQICLMLVLTLAVLAIYTTLTIGAGWLQFKGVSDRWFYPTLALTIAFLMGAVVLSARGLRRVGDESPRAAAAAWPRGKLAIALGVAAALHAMTIWNLDLAARQQLASLRAEAGAVALSVAPPRIPDRDNAALIYQQAFEAMGRFGDQNPAAPGTWEWEQAWKEAWEKRWERWDETGEPPLDPHDPELRRFLARQEAALALYRQAAAKPGCYFDRDYGRLNIRMMLPELLPLRVGARVLALDAICSAVDGDRKRAIGDISAMFGMAEHIRSESLLIQLIVSIVVERLAIDSLEVVLASTHVSAEELPPQWISEDVSYRTYFRRALRTEEALRLATFVEVGDGQYTPAEIAAFAVGGDLHSECVRPQVALAYRVFLLPDDLAAHTRFIEVIDTLAYPPYWQARDRMDEYDRQMRRRPGGLMTAILMPSLSQVAQRVAVAEARRGAARLGLALYRYRVEHGRFPEKPGDLAPKFIAIVPTDPFDGQPLRVKQTGDSAIVYSIGPETASTQEAPFFDVDKKHRAISFTVPAQRPAKK
jgi:hypothetical protein